MILPPFGFTRPACILGTTLIINLISKILIICHKNISMNSYSKKDSNCIFFMARNSYIIGLIGCQNKSQNACGPCKPKKEGV